MVFNQRCSKVKYDTSLFLHGRLMQSFSHLSLFPIGRSRLAKDSHQKILNLAALEANLHGPLLIYPSISRFSFKITKKLEGIHVTAFFCTEIILFQSCIDMAFSLPFRVETGEAWVNITIRPTISANSHSNYCSVYASKHLFGCCKKAIGTWPSLRAWYLGRCDCFLS